MTCTPALLATFVAEAALATVSGVVGAYIASSNVVAVGLVNPTGNTVVALPA